MKHKNLCWREFFEAEKALYAYLLDNCTVLYEVEDRGPRYRISTMRAGVQFEKPPRFIHWIGRLTVDASSFLQMDIELRALYERAMGGSFKWYPVRFPQFFSNIEQINIRTNQAVKSVPVTGAELPLISIQCGLSGRSTHRTRLNKMLAELSGVGLQASIQTIQVEDDVTITLFVNVRSLMQYAGADHIQLRQSTGTQYRALLRGAGQSSGQRHKLGLMVLDQHSDTHIVHSLSQGARPHSLDATGKLIAMPIDLPFSLYRKESKS